MSGRRSVSPILVQTCCDELSREPPSSCQQAKAASTAQSQAVSFILVLKYFCLNTVIAEKHCLWADFPSVASVVRYAFVNSPNYFKCFINNLCIEVVKTKDMYFK